jgi:hypothetical protein
MWCLLLHWTAPLVPARFGWLPAVYAQATSATDGEIGRTSALPYAVAFASTLLVLVIVCAPSRKG